MPIQIPEWMKKAELWIFVRFAMCVVGLVCFAESSSFTHLFGEWNSIKIFVYVLVSTILCLIMIFAGTLRVSTGHLWQAHLTAGTVMLTSVYSFFYDKAVNGKPDTLGLISSVAFVLMFFILSRQIQLGFVMDLLYFSLGFLIIQLMEIKIFLIAVGIAITFALVVLHAISNSPPVIRASQDSDRIVRELISHQLVACAVALNLRNSNLAETILKQVKLLAAYQTGAMKKLNSHFAQALACRIKGIYSQEVLDSSYSDKLYMHFYESCPHLQFAHYTANQAILKAFTSANFVRVIDLGLKQLEQWKDLMQPLSQSGGQVTFWLTGICLPHPCARIESEIQELYHLAEGFGINFHFSKLSCSSLADLDPRKLWDRPRELRIEGEAVVAINSVFELHRALANPDGIEQVLHMIRNVSPRIVTMVEQEVNHNGPSLLERIQEAFPYYSDVFDSLGGPLTGLAPNQDSAMLESYLGREIGNVVGCEGQDRVERHERLSQWQERMRRARFAPVLFDEADLGLAQTYVAGSPAGADYRVENNDGCLMLGSHSRHHITASAWESS